MEILVSPHEINDLSKRWRDHGLRVAFVPTMGALHAGHISLVEIAQKHSDKVIVSIFVNPTQFGPSEDFSKYPRTIQEDMNLLESVKVDAVFLPNTTDMYPHGFETFIDNTVASKDLCGLSRPSHFRGVLTIVAKLFNMVNPHTAVFGKKDYQQFKLIEKMCKDLNLPVEIIGAPIVRESNNLAMSSRNRYLAEEQRQSAFMVPMALDKVKQLFAAGERSADVLRSAAIDFLKHNSFEVNHLYARPKDSVTLSLDYLEIRLARDLSKIDTLITDTVVVLIAAYCFGVRLIDNIELEMT